MFSFIKTCPKCNKKFNIKKVAMSRVTSCPNCKTPLIATTKNTLIAGIVLVIGYGVSNILSTKGIAPFYVPFMIIALLTLFLIEPLTIQYKEKK
ncbi:hypothetical protein ACFO6R_14150 [Eubacterium multiforme]|uniref:CXXC-20-CXXC protein n=1 Tax=Eubacterium multiforme TaxID=83339 RepID=A0ABT9UXG9_9FIRM|nr:hypothetical protein [Eubacterium multiforme]MDQ0151006.1 CXXC-20-CXXC protein [Eubacterium multiforme]